MDGTGLLFEPLLESLAGKCEISVVTHSRANTFPELVEEVESQLPDDRRISLVAESFSGPVAVEIMARQKLDIGASVLCATFCTSPFLQLVRLAVYLPEFLFNIQVIRKAVINSLASENYIDASVKRKVYEIMESEDPKLVKKRLSILRSIDVTERARNVLVPILYLRASRDRIVSCQLGQRLVDNLPCAEVAEVSGPHMLLQAEPDVCSELILEHVTTQTTTKGVGTH